MYPPFEDEIRLEHLQGYLYVQQIIENTATANAGAMKEYSINLISEELEIKNLIELAVSIILNKINQSAGITNVNYKFFKENGQFKFLNNWEIELKEDLNNWFLDKYLSANSILDAYKEYSNQQKDWTKKQREEYLEKGRIAEQESEKRLKEWQPNSNNFINLIKGFLGTNELEVLKIIIPKAIKNKSGYPSHEMNFTVVLYL